MDHGWSRFSLIWSSSAVGRDTELPPSVVFSAEVDRAIPASAICLPFRKLKPPSRLEKDCFHKCCWKTSRH
jgi:hypothetical protein